MKTASCTACGATIIWAITSSGRRMPVDSQYSPLGNVVLEPVKGKATPLARVLTKSEQWPEAGRRLSHFSTCPHADRFRRSH
jgi:hypothetical protein